MYSTFPRVPSARPRADAALTSDGALLLIIAIGVVLACAWVGWHYYESEEDQAHAYALRTVERLAIAHDASYFSSNLSSAARPGYPPNRRRLIMSSLTKLGVPTGPIKLVASASRDKDPNVPGPITRFTTRLTYPTADARLISKLLAGLPLGASSCWRWNGKTKSPHNPGPHHDLPRPRPRRFGSKPFPTGNHGGAGGGQRRRPVAPEGLRIQPAAAQNRAELQINRRFPAAGGAEA